MYDSVLELLREIAAGEDTYLELKQLWQKSHTKIL
jgi:hypothetical protein